MQKGFDRGRRRLIKTADTEKQKKRRQQHRSQIFDTVSIEILANLSSKLR